MAISMGGVHGLQEFHIQVHTRNLQTHRLGGGRGGAIKVQDAAITSEIF